MDVTYGSNIYSADGDKFVLTPHSGVTEITGSLDCTYSINLHSAVGLAATDTGSTITATWVSDIFSTGTLLEVERLKADGTYEFIYSTPVPYSKSSSYTFTELKLHHTQYMISRLLRVNLFTQQ